MKVLQIVGSLGRGGAETMITNINKVAVTKGYQFDYVIHKRQSNGYEELVRSLGGNIFLLDPPGKVGIIKYIKNLKKIIENNGTYDVVHSHTDYQVFLTVIASKMAHVRKCVIHSHNTHFSYLQKIINRICILLFRPTCLACGQEAGKSLYGNFKFKVINNGIFISDYHKYDKLKINELREMYNIKDTDIILGQIGRLTLQKNQEFSLKIIKKLIEKNKNYVLCLIGDGEDKEKLYKKVVELNIKNNVKFLGLQKNMPNIYHMIDMMIMPSLYEGLPVTLVEAQAAGVKSICSTNITAESDFKLGLVKFLELEETKWVAEIEEELNDFSAKPTVEDINKALKEYDVITQSQKLLSQYI